jgi:hypothetical protein
MVSDLKIIRKHGRENIKYTNGKKPGVNEVY